MKTVTLQSRASAALWPRVAPFGLLILMTTSCTIQAQEKPEPVYSSPAAKTAWNFSFGDRVTSGGLLVAPTTVYSLETGYGFEPGSDINVGQSFVTSGKPFFFSAAIPEGNYRVTLTLGDQTGESNTTVKAEARRLMLENVSTVKDQTTTRSFTVNVRTPRIASGGSVLLNDREKGPPLKLHWDEKLTIEFNGSRPCVSSVKIVKVEDATTIFLAGDSTVTDQTNEPFAAWGQMLPRFFRPDVAVANYAESGLALTTSRSQKRLEKMLGLAKAGDWVFIQFGHNDQKDKREGAGPFTTYKAELKDYIVKVRERGARVVLVTPMERRRWSPEGKPQATLSDYAEAVRQVGAEDKVPVIDLNAMSLKFYEALGPENSQEAFVHYAANTFPGQDKALKDDTHFNNYGAYELARIVVEGIKAKTPTLAQCLADNVKPFDASQPEPVESFNLPLSPPTIIRPLS